MQPGDDVQRLLSLGLKPACPAAATGRTAKIQQPCAAFDGCRCRIYDERPQYCRQFECVLFQRLKSGQVTRAQALRTIRLTRRKATQVLGLLRKMGDTDEHLSLASRFRRTTKRMEQSVQASTGQLALYGELTLAMHSLGQVLSESFYPGWVRQS